MSNLDIEGLSRVVQTGDAGRFLTGGPSIASEAQVAREMRTQGMEVPASGGPGEAAPGKSFSDILLSSVSQVNQDQVQADTAIKELVSGRSKNIHETMLAVERADTSLKMMMQVRNKILDAYKEIMHMQV